MADQGAQGITINCRVLPLLLIMFLLLLTILTITNGGMVVAKDTVFLPELGSILDTVSEDTEDTAPLVSVS